MKPAGPDLCWAPLVHGLLGPKGLGVSAHPLLLGLHSCIVPEVHEGGRHGHTQPGPALTLPCTSSLPLCVEGTLGVQQQEEFVLGLGTVPREEVMLQGHGACDRADHVDVTALQASEWEGNSRSGMAVWKERPASPPTFLLLASPDFSESPTGRLCLSSSLSACKMVWARVGRVPQPHPVLLPPPPFLRLFLLWRSHPPPQSRKTTAAFTQAPQDAHLTRSSQQIQGRWGQWHSEG